MSAYTAFTEALKVIRSMPDALCTASAVDRIVAAIAVIADDDEAAHSAEDRLWTAVMYAIAERINIDSAEDLCKAARKTLGIEFRRWCA